MHSSMARRASALWLAVLALLILSSLLAFSQSTGGRILGRVADPTGAVLAGVKITLVNEATGATSLYNEALGTTSNVYNYDRVKGRE